MPVPTLQRSRALDQAIRLVVDECATRHGMSERPTRLLLEAVLRGTNDNILLAKVCGVSVNTIKTQRRQLLRITETDNLCQLTHCIVREALRRALAR